MSGYLMRLAAAALGQRSSIRPLVRPPFDRGADSLRLDTEDFVAAAHDDSPVFFQPQSSRAEPRDADVPTPSLGHVSTTVRRPAAAAKDRDNALFESEPSLGPRLAENAMEKPRGITPRAISDSGIRPSIRMATERVEVSTSKSQNSSREVAGAGSRAPVENEVYIHIGRVEVTAAPPQPTIRPATPASRKVPSLEEYLKRGRSR